MPLLKYPLWQKFPVSTAEVISLLYLFVRLLINIKRLKDHGCNHYLHMKKYEERATRRPAAAGKNTMGEDNHNNLKYLQVQGSPFIQTQALIALFLNHDQAGDH